MSRENNARRQYLAARLAAHSATDQERDEALGTILLSLFSKDDVEAIVDERHEALCASCTAKKERREDMKEWVIRELIRLVGWSLTIIGAVIGIKECVLK